MPSRIWNKPTESASPWSRFFIPDSTSAAITGSSGGRPRASACFPIHAATSAGGASSPGYASGASPKELPPESDESAPSELSDDESPSEESPSEESPSEESPPEESPSDAS